MSSPGCGACPHDPTRGHGGLQLADILTAGQRQEGAQRTWRAVSGPRVQSRGDNLGLPESRVLGEGRSCGDAVSRIICPPCSQWHGSVLPCTSPAAANAKSRIPTPLLSPPPTLARRTAEELHASVQDRWKWNGHSVFILDGSSVSIAGQLHEPGRCIRSRPIKGGARLSPGADHGAALPGDQQLHGCAIALRTPARAPVKRASSDACTTRSNPVMWYLPTPFSTITSSPANCAIEASIWLSMSTSIGEKLA